MTGDREREYESFYLDILGWPLKAVWITWENQREPGAERCLRHGSMSSKRSMTSKPCRKLRFARTTIRAICRKAEPRVLPKPSLVLSASGGCRENGRL